MNRKGFTLVEIIITLALIGIISVFILTVFDTGLINIVRAGLRTEAVNMAENKFLNEGLSVGEIIDVNLTLPTPEGDKNFIIKGHNTKGRILLNEGKRTKVEVEIQAFVIKK